MDFTFINLLKREQKDLCFQNISVGRERGDGVLDSKAVEEALGRSSEWSNQTHPLALDLEDAERPLSWRIPELPPPPSV